MLTVFVQILEELLPITAIFVSVSCLPESLDRCCHLLISIKFWESCCKYSNCCELRAKSLGRCCHLLMCNGAGKNAVHVVQHILNSGRLILLHQASAACNIPCVI